jgi:hypothetical protein
LEVGARGGLDGDHVLPKQEFKDAIAEHERNIGRELSDTEIGQVNDLMNSKENLRPMPKSYNRSKQDSLARDWQNKGTEISDSVDPAYINDLQKTQRSVSRKLGRLLDNFE